MIHYIPNTKKDQQRMLEEIGLNSIDDLYALIPTELLEKCQISLPEPLSELEIKRLLTQHSRRNADADVYLSFCGAGAYSHFSPAIVDQLLLRGEFFTAYTPYQPELSQGTLQAIYEYQSLLCALTGMEVANASMYDGASAAAEAVLMAQRITKKRDTILLAESLHPHYRQVVDTYTAHQQEQKALVPFTDEGTIDLQKLESLLNDKVSCIVVQSPNFFGCIEDVEAITEKAQQHGIVTIMVVTEPISLGLLKSPGEMGVEIFAGEGQSLGLSLNYGGPYLGLFAARKQFVRSMPGRIVGKTVDADGNSGYVLTLSTREQHIRRERATSNICTNQALCALAVTIYMSAMGKNGLKEVALSNIQLSEYLKSEIGKLPGYSVPFNAPTFNEFVMRTPVPAQKIYQACLAKNIVAGMTVDCYYPDRFDMNHLLVCATEILSKNDIDTFIGVLRQFN